MTRPWPALLTLLITASGCAARSWDPGVASWYGPGFRGKPTASGETFRPARRTAAHRTLPFGTVLIVEHADGGKRVRVVVNDRGPYVDGRTLDLSQGAARRIGMIEEGVAHVRVSVVGCKGRYDGPRACGQAGRP